MVTLVHSCNKCTSGTGSSRIGRHVYLMLITQVGLTLPIHQREWSSLNKWYEKTAMLQLLPWNLALAMALLTILCTMYSSTTKCEQDGCLNNSHQIWRTGVKNLWGVIKMKGMLFFSAQWLKMEAGPITSSHKQTVSKERRNPNSQKPQKCRAQLRQVKWCWRCSGTVRGPILEHYMSNGTTITSSSYCDLIANHLKPEIQYKRRGLLTTCVLLLHDIARPYTVHATVANINDPRSECLLHPPHSTHLAPSDFHVCWALKEELSGRKFGSNEVQEAVYDRLCHQPRDLFHGDSSFTKALERMYGT